MNAIIIRQVKNADRGEWLRLRLALWPRETRAHLERELLQIAANPMVTPVFVAESTDGNLAGFLEGNLRSTAQGCFTSPVAYIEGWYVDERWRRQGIGRRLVAAMEDWARSKGCSEVASDCVLDNEVSFEAHRALGYAEEGRLVHFRKAIHGGPAR